MAQANEKLRSLTNRIASLLPMVDATDLGPLGEISVILDEISEEKGSPRALKTLTQRGKKLTESTILGDISLEAGLLKLNQCVERLMLSASEQEKTETAASFEDGDGSAFPNDQELLIKFASQLKLVLEDFEESAMDLENSRPEAMGDIRRILHTLKGEFGVLGLAQYSQLMHRVENTIEEGRATPDCFFQLKDLLAVRIPQLLAGVVPPLPERDIQAVLSLSSQGAPALDKKYSEVSPARGPVQKKKEESREIAGDPSLLRDFVLESREHIHTAEACLLELETDPTNSERLNALFRSFHTVKGVAGFLALTEVSELSHAVENIIDRARRTEMLLHPACIDLLLEATDFLKELVDAVEKSIGNNLFVVPKRFGEMMELVRTSCAVTADAAPVPMKGKIGEILISQGSATLDAVADALVKQENGDGRPIGELLVESGAVSPQSVGNALASQNAARVSGSVDETIRVPVGKLDQLIDAIGEAVIAHSMIAGHPSLSQVQSQDLDRKVSQTSLIMRQVQELSMSLRMVSIKSTFQKMARLVRDLSKKVGKDIGIALDGEDTELDKTVVENIGDPLIHMIRNSVDHGIETPQERAKTGKPVHATVTLRAYHKAGSVVIEVGDDGRGLNKAAILAKAKEKGLTNENTSYSDQEIYQFIFMPGFSTAKVVSDVSGRGVGMDVVRRNIQNLRGSVDIKSEEGAGTLFTIRLPLTLAIINGMIVHVASQTCILPTLSIIESFRPSDHQVSTILGKCEMVQFRGQQLPLQRLSGLFRQEECDADASSGIVIIVEDMLGKKTGLLVDKIVGQQQVVIKSLGKGMGEVPGVSGGAIMADGTVSLILDIEEIVKARE